MPPGTSIVANLYRIAKTPRISASHNRRSWDRLETRLGSGRATLDELVAFCEGHDHPKGARGFVKHCIQSQWLVAADSRRLPTKTAKLQTEFSAFPQASKIPESATGVYLAYPTSTTMKPTYRGLKTKVNSRHTKVGITVDGFAKRGAQYTKTFDGEVVFKPLVSVTSARLMALEKKILAEVAARFERVGSAREWFDTQDRNAVE